MWVLSKAGFFSAVNYDPSKDRDPRSPFPKIAKSAGTHKLVRCRRLEHLEKLKVVVPNVIMVDDRTADYRYRAVITNKQWIGFLVHEVNDMDYWSHFKEAMRAAQPQHLKAGMYSAAMSTWGNFMNLQTTKQYSGTHNAKAPQGGDAVADYQRQQGVHPFGGGRKGRKGKQKPLGGPKYDARQNQQAGFSGPFGPMKQSGQPKALPPGPPPSGQQPLFQTPGEKATNPPSDQYDGWLDDILAQGGTVEESGVVYRTETPATTADKWTPERLVNVITSQGGSLVFGSEDLAKMDNLAFEFLIVLHEKFGTKAHVSGAVVSKQLEDFNASIAVAEEK